MPVPPLPNELIRPILTFAVQGLPQPERRAECARFALVSKAWTTPSMMLAWHAVWLWTAGDKWRKLVQHLLKYPQVLSYVKWLDARLPSIAHSQGEPSHAHEASTLQIEPAPFVGGKALSDLKRLLKACPNVDSLMLPDSQPIFKLLKFCSQAPFAKNLVELRLFHLQTEGIDMAHLAKPIASFPNLFRLNIRGTFFGSASTLCTCSAIRVQQLVPISSLGLHCLEEPNCDFAISAYRAILNVIEPAALHECHIDVRYDNMSCLDLLKQFKNLRHLFVYFPSASDVQSSLKDLQRCLSGLTNLRTLEINPHTRYSEIESNLPTLRAPTSINDFFDSLPSNLYRIFLGGVYFDDMKDLRRSSSALFTASTASSSATDLSTDLTATTTTCRTRKATRTMRR